MAYALDNALYQWQEGERRMREASGPETGELERAVRAVYGELRRRLGSSFVVAELATAYGEDLSWAEDAARGVSALALLPLIQRVVERVCHRPSRRYPVGRPLGPIPVGLPRGSRVAPS